MNVPCSPTTLQAESSACIFGCKFTIVSWERALQAIETMIIDAPPVPKICAFINADCLNQYYANAAYAGLLSQVDFLMPDGIGVAIAARWYGTPVKANLNGSDLLPKLCRMPYSIYLLGGSPGVAEKARINLERDYPGVKIAGTDHGFMVDEAAERAAIERINRIRPDILLVGMGVPRQEMWMFRHRNELACKVAIGVGGLLDFASGRIPRAPVWLRRLRLEWAYRLYNEPCRLFRRYVIGNPLFLWRMFFHGSKNMHSDVVSSPELAGNKTEN